jgi:SRSO17 transposase
MDADTVLRIRPTLTRYLHEFDGCLGRVTNGEHFAAYVTGQLSDLDRKSVEPMADAAGVARRSLQEFLSLFRWDESAMRDRLQRRVARRHGHPHSIGIIDETSFAKKGTETACVQRQHCGSLGKIENCVVSVHLGYAAGDFHTLLDGKLFLPKETWHERRYRCQAAGIPDEVVYQPKWELALGQVQQALRNGVRFTWWTFDEYYGSKPRFLRGLEGLGQNYVAEMPSSFVCWTRLPEVRYREHGRERSRKGRGVRARLKVRNTPAVEVRHILKHSPVMRAVPWERYRVKDGHKGPMVWEAKRIPVWIKDDQGLPIGPYVLVVARNALNTDEIKYFLSNAQESTPTETLLLVAFSRWRIERVFEDSKTELGMDHFEVRKYVSIQRHLILTCVSHLFLSEYCEANRGEKAGTDRESGPDGHTQTGADLAGRPAVYTSLGRADRCGTSEDPTLQRQGETLPSQENNRPSTLPRHIPQGLTAMPMGRLLAV